MAANVGNGPAASSSAPRPRDFEQSNGARTDAANTQSIDETASHLKDMVSDDLAAVTDTAKDVAADVTDKATEIADKQKGYVADQIGKVASAIERVGQELKSDDAGAIGGYASDLGASARQFADKVKDKDFRQIAGIAEDFGRRQPLAFLGLAAVAGLAASRFIMASKPSAPTAVRTAPHGDRTGDSYNG
jgi:ElaB/YqjD/DUF883 family membrane-anchored ribosome-binding protein